MKFSVLWLLGALAASAQFRAIDVSFQGTGCVTCTGTLPERVRRLRGVESAEVDAAAQVLKVRLAAQNRVRVEQVRDFVEQDGTKATKATVAATGVISKDGDHWVLELPAARYRLEAAGAAIAPGPCVMNGEIPSLHTDSGLLTIRVVRATARHP
jgi:cation transport ATPase